MDNYKFFEYNFNVFVFALNEFYQRNKLVLFPGSSAVEQLTVNQLAGGSNPSRGAIFKY
tara:strand:+ start:1816 stop:1992 length:177 start_codon:yes stop_codon:yes gene_type:complete